MNIFSIVPFAAAMLSALSITPQSATASDLTLKKGQYLTIVLPETNPAGNDVRKSYYSKAFPLGTKFGLKREMGLNVDQALISDYSPSAALFFSYPNKQSEAKLAKHPKWAGIKAMRPEAWKEIKFYSAEIAEDLDIHFDPNKSYTLVVAWLNPDNPNDYDRYLDGIKESVNAVGGRFIYKMKNPSFEANASSDAPGQLTFVEWDTLDGFSKVRQNADYKKYTQYRQSGTKKLEFYRLSAPTKS